MLYALLAVAFARHHHMQTAPTPAAADASTAVTVTSPGVDPSTNTLEGKYCAMNNLLSRNEIKLNTVGESMPLVITNLKSTLLCIEMTNGSSTASDKTLWLYVNVDAQPTTTTPPTIRYTEGLNYTDYGKSTPVRTLFQVSNNIPAGYFGPINYNSYANMLTAAFNNYNINVYSLKAAITTPISNENDALTNCGQSVGTLTFKSQFGSVLLSVIAVAAAVFL